MADTVTVRNVCPAKITYDLDVPGDQVYPNIAPGDTVEVPASAVLAETVWKVVTPAKKTEEKSK